MKSVSGSDPDAAGSQRSTGLPAEGGAAAHEFDDDGYLMGAWRSLTTTWATNSRVEDVGQALLASWGEPHRRYHNIAHLREVLLHIDELASNAADPDAVRLAAWYHDVVYRGRPDDEENSAQRAEADLTLLGLPSALIAEVGRLVRLTATHDPLHDDTNGTTLSDADLAILAAPAERYGQYVAAVRAEYAHVPDDQFRAGRTRVLRGLLDGPAIFRTPIARERWETQARANLGAELEVLAASTQRT